MYRASGWGRVLHHRFHDIPLFAISGDDRLSGPICRSAELYDDLERMKCGHCPIKRRCIGERAPRICELVDPEHRDYAPEYVAVLPDWMEYPTALERLRGLARAVWDLGVRLIRGRPGFVSRGEFRRRLDLCGGCQYFDARGKRCMKCGCYAALKLRLAGESCPLEPPRWRSIPG